MRMMIAIAAGLLATSATAQTTTVTRTVERTHADMRNYDDGRHHAAMHRTCRTQWRHHRRVRVCRTTRR